MLHFLWVQRGLAPKENEACVGAGRERKTIKKSRQAGLKRGATYCKGPHARECEVAMTAILVLEASGPKGGNFRFTVKIGLGWLHWLWGG